VLLIALLVVLAYLAALPEAVEVDRALPRTVVGRTRSASQMMLTSVTGVLVVLFGVPLEIGLRVRRRVLARGRAAWRGALAVAVSAAVGVAVAWWPARRWITEQAVAGAVARTQVPLPPEDLPAYEAWAGEIAGAYASKALVAFAAVWVVLRIVLAVAEHRLRRPAPGV
jgi:hypothetical protein